MLRTLFTEEARAMGRTHFLILGVATLVGAVLVLVGLLDLPVVGDLARLLVVCVLAASAAGVFVHCCVEYWQSMYGQRGYLTMTVPVRGRVVYAAKVAYTVVATVVAAVLAASAIALAHAVDAWHKGTALSEAFAPLREVLDLLGAGRVVAAALLLLLHLASWVLMLTALMSIGAQARWNHMGFGAPVLGFVILYLVSQVVSLVGMLLLPLTISTFTGDILWEPMLGAFVDSLGIGRAPEVVGLGFLPATWCLAAALGWWAVRAVERHTSLR